jgi:hypothetical protein
MTTNNSVTTKPEEPTKDDLQGMPSAAIPGVSAESAKPLPTNNILWKATGRVCEGRGIVERVKMYEKKGGGWRMGKHVDETIYTTIKEFYTNEVKPRKEAKELMVKRRMGEGVGNEAKQIAGLTGTRDSIVQKFIDDFNLNAKNLFNFIAKGKEKVRKDFATAMSGRPGNKYQGDFVGMFGESIVNEACWDGYKQVGGKMKNGKMVPNCVPVSEDINSDDDVNNGLVEPEEYDVEDEDMVDFISFMRSYSKQLSEANCNCVYEAEYQGRDVKLGKPMQGDVKKFKVYVKNPAGNVVKVNFGQKGMKIRKSNPAARKSFRARMNCDSPGPRTKANYWSCRKW